MAPGSPGTIAVSIAGPESDGELRGLARWLQEEDALRGRVQLVDDPARPGHMGGVTDAVVVVLTSGSAAAFSSALFDWLSRKREAHKVSLKLRHASGKELELDCGSPADAKEVMGEIRGFFGDQE